MDPMQRRLICTYTCTPALPWGNLTMGIRGRSHMTSALREEGRLAIDRLREWDSDRGRGPKSPNYCGRHM